MTDVLVCGHLCLDLLPDLSGVAAAAVGAPGKLVESGALAVATGGAVSNTGLALHRLGVAVGLMATLGDDAIGRLTAAHLAAHDPALTRHLRVRSGLASSYSVVLAPRGRDRSFLHHPGPNAAFGVDDVDFDAVRRTRLFHLGYPPIMPRLIAADGAELEALYRQAKACGAATSMDMVVPDANAPSGWADWPAILRAVLPYVDIFLPSVDEALFMLRRGGVAAPAQLDRAYLHRLAGDLLEMGVAVAGIKLGERGLYLRTAGAQTIRRLGRLEVDADAWADREYWQPAYRVDVAGTTGAGDSAYAGFLAAMLRGLPPQACLQWASAVGACSVERVDATSGIRTWAETAARMESGWNTLPELTC